MCSRFFFCLRLINDACRGVKSALLRWSCPPSPLLEDSNCDSRQELIPLFFHGLLMEKQLYVGSQFEVFHGSSAPTLNIWRSFHWQSRVYLPVCGSVTSVRKHCVFRHSGWGLCNNSWLRPLTYCVVESPVSFPVSLRLVKKLGHSQSCLQLEWHTHEQRSKGEWVVVEEEKWKESFVGACVHWWLFTFCAGSAHNQKIKALLTGARLWKPSHIQWSFIRKM